MAHSPRKLIVNNTSKTVVCDDATIADDALTRARGLLGRSAMRPGEGLLLTPAPSIHTAFMRFPIDVVFLGPELEAIKLVPWMRPWRVASARRARAVLELEAGTIADRSIRVGDRFGVLDLHVWRSAQIEVARA